MKKIFKPLKLAKYVKQIAVFILLFAIFAGAGLTHATHGSSGNVKTYSQDEIIKSLGQANNFAVFAKNFTNNNHMEGSIAVENLLGASSNLGNTDNVYIYTEQSVFNIKITKTLGGQITTAQTFKIGAYLKNSDGSYTLIKTVDITTDLSGNGSAILDTTGLTPGMEYYFFEIDDKGQPITSNTGIINGQEYTVSVTTSLDSNVIETPSSGVSNVSYIENFYNGNEGIELFQSNNKEKASVIAGKDNQYSSVNNNQNIITGVDGTNYKLGPNVNVNLVNGQFPIDFDSELTNLANISSKLATTANTDTVKVINIKLTDNGQGIDYSQITSGGTQVSNIKDFNDWNNYGLTTEGKFLVINVDCTNASNNNNQFSLRGCKIDNNDAMNWNKIANRVIWNFYTSDGNNYSSFDGKIIYEGGLGTLLAPKATVSCTASTNGSVIGNTVDHPSCEIHHIKLSETTVTEETNMSVDVINDPSNIGGLKIKKDVTVNGSEPSKDNTSLVDGTYVFDIYDESKTNLVRSNVEVVISNGKSNEVTVSGLEPGTYLVSEKTDNLPKGMSLTGSNDIKVVVKANNTEDLPVAKFVNNIDVGSVIIKKNVTLNGDVTNSNELDGTYQFTLTNKEDSTIVYNEEIVIENGKSKTVQIDNIIPGTYIVTENTEGFIENNLSVVENNQEITISANNISSIPVVSFTNNKDTTGSLIIKKNVVDNGEAITSNLGDGDYKFNIKDSANNVIKQIIVNITNGQSEIVTVNGLKPGTYTVEEVDIPDNMKLLTANNVQVIVSPNDINGIQTAEFTNSIVRGSLDITKKVTVNEKSAVGSTLADGTYQFAVKNSDNDIIATKEIIITNGNSNTVRVEGLLPGTYTIEEIGSTNEDAKLLSSKNTKIKITANNVTTIQTAEFTNNVDIKTGSLKIEKNVTYNGKQTSSTKADGLYTFVVKDVSNTTVATRNIKITNGQSSNVIVENLKPGIYTVEEIPNNDATLVDSKNTKVEVKANNTTDIPTTVFTNNVTEGKLKITKHVLVNQEKTTTTKADGTYKFAIKDSTGNLVTTKEITIEDGKSNSVTVSGLKPGTYTIEEVENNGLQLIDVTSSGSVNENTATIVIDENTSGDIQIETVDFTNNKNHGSLKITKNVLVNGETTTTDIADGIYNFKVTGPNDYSKEVSIKIKDGVSNNVVLTDLEPGEYAIEEINLPDDMTLVLNEGESFVKNVYVAGGKDAEVSLVSFTNNKIVTGSLEITKDVTINGNDPEGSQLVDGVYSFTIIGPNGYQEVKTIEILDGKALNSIKLTDLQLGTYTITENSEGLSDRNISITQGGQGIVIELNLDNYNDANIAKFINNLTLEDTALTIKKDIDENTNQYEEAVNKLYTFKITNKKIPDGSSYVANDGITTITFNNGEAVLTLKGESEITFTSLPAGKYIVEETEATVEGYRLTTDYQDDSGDEDDQLIELTNGQVNMITITNSYEYYNQTGSMSITKILKKYNQTLNGGTFVFDVTGTKVNSSGETIEIYNGVIGMVVNNSGTFTTNRLTDLPIEPGITYIVKEIYSGSAYRPVQDTVVISLNTMEDIEAYKTANGEIVLTAAFENDYDGTTTGGGGVINIYGVESVEQIFYRNRGTDQ